MARNLYIPQPVLHAIATHIEQAIPRAVDGYLSAHEDEDTLTGHLGATLRTNTHTIIVQDQEQGSGEWKWRIDYTKFRGRGAHAAENYLGADGIFELKLLRGATEQTKSLLFQAKKEWRSDPTLLKQAIRLTTWREAAFILNYTPQNFEAIRLDDAIASRGDRSAVKQATPLSSFLSEQFLPCLVGDTDLRYNAALHRLSWRTMSNEQVATDFTVGHRIRFDIKAPISRTAIVSNPKMVNWGKIHDHRMKAEYEDILGVSLAASEKEKTQARNTLALAYHPDRFNLNDELLNQLLKKRTQETNEAYTQLKKKKK
jgi:hypothetical protein